MRLSDKERATAELLGDGVLAEGVRVALQIGALLGPAKVRVILDGGVTQAEQAEKTLFPKGKS